MDYKVNSGIWGTMFGVPCIVADNLLKIADESQIKVLLYLLRHSEKNLTAEEISANTGVGTEKVADAVLFWQQVNVLSTSASTSVSVPAAQPIIEPVKEIAADTPAQPTAPLGNAPLKTTQLHPSEIADILAANENISDLFRISETLLGTLTPAMQNTLIWMSDYLSLGNEVILTLLGYCIDADKTNPKYIEKIASDWAENEINTLELATAEIERRNQARDFTNEIKRIFELRQNPTTNQQKMITKWQADRLPLDMIHLAYEKTVEQINKVSFEYINKILESWKLSGYSSVSDVKNAEEEYKRRKSGSPAASDGFDPDKYKMLINNV